MQRTNGMNTRDGFGAACALPLSDFILCELEKCRLRFALSMKTKLKEAVVRIPCAISLFAISLVIATSSFAQTTAPNAAPAAVVPKENSGVIHRAASPGPIVVKLDFRKVDGSANLTVNPDGTYLFSGTVKDKKPGRDFDISLALKSSLGGIIVFRFAGDAANGVQWSKQGQSDILKDNFRTFSGKDDWDVEWRLPLNAKGIAMRYEEREKRKEKLKMEIDAAIKRHDQKVADERKAALEKEQKAEQEQAQHQQAQSGGGSSVGSVLGTIGAVAGTILSFF
jgi:hypothetical protein